ncbi:Putative ribonuclease H protein [Apostasia shenzhenica]|uniref:Ribonuclease H protein n=1 Tax=Apostasia shenzhenica TaxID=1088818 RepID=A0A2I0BFG3_9ASPA|nr:Putative ribonuclease H protein [Apostasia shenzhenica]
MAEIEKLIRRFLWSGNLTSNAAHLVAWEQVTKPKSAGGLGIHHLEEWRSILVAKHAFNFLSNANTLWVKCFQAKYGKRETIFSTKRGDSWAWKLICQGGTIALHNSLWKIGSGDSTKVMEDAWADPNPFMRWPTFINTTELPPLTVHQLLNANGEWNQAELHKFFGSELALRIGRLPRLDKEERDCLVWLKSDSTKSPTAALYRDLFRGRELPHSWVWKLRAQPRYVTFLWRICCDAIPTFTWLKRRHLRESDRCPWGCSAEEDLQHFVCECSFTCVIFDALQRQQADTITGVDTVLPEEATCELQASPSSPQQPCFVSRKCKKRKAPTTALPTVKAKKVQFALPDPDAGFCTVHMTIPPALQDSGQNQPKRKRADVPTTPNPLSWHDEGEKSHRKTPRLAYGSRDPFFDNLFSAGCCDDDDSSTSSVLRKRHPAADSCGAQPRAATAASKPAAAAAATTANPAAAAAAPAANHAAAAAAAAAAAPPAAAATAAAAEPAAATASDSVVAAGVLSAAVAAVECSSAVGPAAEYNSAVGPAADCNPSAAPADGHQPPHARNAQLLNLFLSNLQLRVQKNPGDPQAIREVAALYHSWRARNARVHNKPFLLPRVIVALVHVSEAQEQPSSNVGNWAVVTPLHPTGIPHPRDGLR